MKLDYFPTHGRAHAIRMLLSHCKVEYEDFHHNRKTFLEVKENYTYGQVPVLHLDDGTQLAQTGAIIRYIARVWGDENMYPTHSAELTYKIDKCMDECGDLGKEIAKFNYPYHPEIKNKDDHFLTFITKTFPAYLKELDGKFGDNKYLLGNEMTLADIVVASTFIKVVYNDEYENCDILQCVVNKSPKTLQWITMMLSIFKDFTENMVKCGF